MSKFVYFYGSEEEVKSLIRHFSVYFHVNYTQVSDSWKIEFISQKSFSEFVNNLSPKTQEKMYQTLKPYVSDPKHSGRKKINLPSKEELQAERQSLSVAQLAKKYNCSVTTINRRLGLIKKKG